MRRWRAGWEWMKGLGMEGLEIRGLGIEWLGMEGPEMEGLGIEGLAMEAKTEVEVEMVENWERKGGLVGMRGDEGG